MRASSIVTVDGIPLRLSVVRKRVRHVNARLVGDTLRVSAPPELADHELEEIIHSLARRLTRRQRADQLNQGERLLALARRVAGKLPNTIRVTDVRFVTTQQARWGSYSLRTGIIRLHGALASMPPWVLEAVIAHELAHAVHPNHSSAFWQLVRRACQHTDRAQAFLEGVSWTAAHWESLPPVERGILAGG